MKKILLLTLGLFFIKAYSQNIASGYYHSLSICTDRTAQAWGNNSRGQLGSGNTSYSNLPVSVLNLEDIAKIDGGFYYSLALKNDGTVWAWGDNYSGTLGNGTTTNSSIPVQVTGVSNVKSIAAGAYHALVLKNDSTVLSWGSNGAGQLGTGNSTPSLVPVQVAGLDSIIAIAAGDEHSLALKSDSTVWAWGMNDQGEIGMGSTVPWTIHSPVQVLNLKGIVAIAGGGYKFSLALKADGTVWAWGYNQWGQLGNGTNLQSSVPVQVSNLTGITSIAVHGGQGHAVALRNDGTVWAWGYNIYGQLGNRTTIDSNIPLQVYGLSDVVSISCGHGYSMALKNDGTLWAWGDNQHGQLGIGTFTGSYSSPVQVTSLCSMPVSVNQIEGNSEITAYPNPTSGTLTINVGNGIPGYEYRIVDLSGHQVAGGRLISSLATLDLTQFSTGIYFVIITGQKRQIIKVQKY